MSERFQLGNFCCEYSTEEDLEREKQERERYFKELQEEYERMKANGEIPVDSSEAEKTDTTELVNHSESTDDELPEDFKKRELEALDILEKMLKQKGLSL